jgi:hypothetical protein
MIMLASRCLLVRVDPEHGGEILDLTELASGRQLLGRPPFGSERPLGGDLGEQAWTRRYRGGWQMLAPNAGNRCEFEGTSHGFHGRASNDPWDVLSATASSATLVWEGHGLAIERTLTLEDDLLRVAVRARAQSARVPLVAVEHVALGLELIEPEVEITLPGGIAFEMSESEGPRRIPADAPQWPHVLFRNATVRRADRWRLADPISRLLCVADLPVGSVLVRNPARDVALELSWDASWLRHLWIWHEVRTTDGSYRRQAEMLVVEPASVPHHLGLSAAVEEHQARWLEPGESARYELVARPMVGLGEGYG